MFGLVSLFTSFIMLSWRYVISSLLGGLTLLGLFVADRVLLAQTPQSAKILFEGLVIPTLYNAFFLALCAIPFSFTLILLARIICLKSWIYFAIIGAASGYGALWILLNYFQKNHISLDINSPQLLATMAGGLITGIFYRLIAIK